MTRFLLGDIPVEVRFKDIKQVRLSVHPPDGHVRISAPRRIDMDTVRAFAMSKLEWIRRVQRRLRSQERTMLHAYLDHESHFVWGQCYPLAVREHDAPPLVELQHNRLLLQLRPGSRHERRRALLDAWYRQQVRQAVPPLIAAWAPMMGVRVGGLLVRQMKTRWGSCNTRSHDIRLNTELAKRPPSCLEYVLVHEMTHLLEPSHNHRFKALMDRFMPDWRQRRHQLNDPPVRQEA